jgi:2,4-dienoyl-CoA reductase-like NADH-dependent reductase (Old Yellow Enzyme family)
MPKLFEPIQIKSLLLKNRIVVSPMCQYSAEDGFANDWHLVHLGSRAVGGAALVIAEATAVAPEGRISPNDLGIWKDAHIPALKRVTNFIEQQGSIPGIQLAHAGRKASFPAPWAGTELLTADAGGWQTIAPSSIAFNEKYALPDSMSVEAIEQLIQDFAHAAQRALAAGFKVIEIHAAHGYLIHEFLSPISNLRTDAYGGSFENRIKLLVNCIGEIQKNWPTELPIFVRISATEWVEGGWTIEDSIQLAKILKEIGVDLVDCSSGGNASNAKIALVPGYQVPLAKQVKHQAGILTGAVGLIYSATHAEEILLNEEADLIFMAREFLRDPYFPLHAAKELNATISWPNQYLRAKR